MIATYDIGTGRRSSEVVKHNGKTIWVKAPDGKKLIKRHKVKHNVIFTKEKK